ncbi:MAG: cupin domain-containing protein [Bacteroidales bacterium]|nr:cupin domain-containing protein [Bacteroidales bacterium]
MDKIINDLIAYSDEGIMSKTVEKTEKLDVTLFCMAKGTEISEHTSRKQGFVYVVEGDGIFNLEGKEIRMLPGTFIYMTENAVHWIKAKENTSFILALVSNS